jgi:phytoene synthase
MRFSGPSGTDLAACDAILRVGSKSFRAAALLLPRDIRQPATALYAFCRLADDAIDEGPGDAATIALLEQRVIAAHAGRPHEHPVDRAFSEAVRAVSLPPAVTLALIEGLAWDAQGRRYESFDDLCDYAARVAGSVGVMMATLMDRRAPEVLARAADLGVAMQLSNIARDVGADAAMGRIYLPLSWLREAGIDHDAFLADPRFSPALAGIAALPASCRAGIRAARLIYAEIGHEVARRGHDGVSRRAVVPAWRKLGLLGHALAGGSRDAMQIGLPALPATAYLVTAVAVMSQGPRPPLHAAVVPWWDLVGRTTALAKRSSDRLSCMAVTLSPPSEVRTSERA